MLYVCVLHSAGQKSAWLICFSFYNYRWQANYSIQADLSYIGLYISVKIFFLRHFYSWKIMIGASLVMNRGTWCMNNSAAPRNQDFPPTHLLSVLVGWRRVYPSSGSVIGWSLDQNCDIYYTLLHIHNGGTHHWALMLWTVSFIIILTVNFGRRSLPV